MRMRYSGPEDFASWMQDGGMEGIPMQPGEASWASLKCGGGPHQEDVVVGMGTWAIEQSTTTIGVREIPYAGTEAPTTIKRHAMRDPLTQGI